MKKYITSNLVMETSLLEKIRKKDTKCEIYSEENIKGVKISRLNIHDKSQENEFGCKIGRYVTVYTGEMWRLDVHKTKNLIEVLSRELRVMIENACGRAVDKALSVLVIGIGNRQITPDAIGPMTVDKITVTRHIKSIDINVYNALEMCEVSALNCGVMGETGMMTLEIVKGVVEQTKPDVVVLIDALTAKEYSRLASTVQISDSGIAPGSGIGNVAGAIDKYSLGVPAVSIGVPTVISAATLIGDAMRRSGEVRMNERLERILEESRGFFVSPKESDIITLSVSDVLSRVVDNALAVIKP